MINVIDSAFEVAAKLLGVVDKLIPSDELRMEQFKARYPLRFERIQKRAMAVRLRKLRSLHRYMTTKGISPEALVKYVGGDSTTLQILQELNQNVKQ